MASSSSDLSGDPASAADPAAPEVPSKNAAKKLQRLKQKEAGKKAPAAAVAAGGPQKPQNDEDMDPTQYYENRLRVLVAMMASGKQPYPHKFHVSDTVPEFVSKYEGLEVGEHVKDETVNLAGRIMNKRSSSSKLLFYDLYGGGVKVQVMADARGADRERRSTANGSP